VAPGFACRTSVHAGAFSFSHQRSLRWNRLEGLERLLGEGEALWSLERPACADQMSKHLERDPAGAVM
jgi:hypothetical protein